MVAGVEGRWLSWSVLWAMLASVCVTLATGCEEPPLPEGFERVTIDNRTFDLEIAANDAVRFKGLSGRTEIKDNGGMLFVFADARRLNFVMRDCPIPIDIIFLDGNGRVVAKHKMLPEAPRRPTETDEGYNQRLKMYPSGYGAQFAIELKANTLDQLKIKEGDQIKLDLAKLKALAK